MLPLYDLASDRWSFPLAACTEHTTHTLPRKLCLARTFRPADRLAGVTPADQIEALRQGLGQPDYFPPEILHELILEDAVRGGALEKRLQTSNRLAAVQFGDSTLLVHPSGPDGGKHVCFSRILPYQGPEGDQRWQSLPRDFCEWDCGLSQIRRIRLDGTRVFAMNDESVSVFTVDHQSHEDPMWIGGIAAGSSAALVDFVHLGDGRLVLLDEAGVLWRDGEPVASVPYQCLAAHPGRVPHLFLAATLHAVQVFDVRTGRAVEVLQSRHEILAIQSLGGTSYAVSTAESLGMHDLAMAGQPVLEWPNRHAFASPVKRIDCCGDQMLVDTAEASFVMPWTAPSWAVPRRLPFGLLAAAGSAALSREGGWTRFNMYADCSVFYVESRPGPGPCRIDGAFDLLLGDVSVDYAATEEVESSLKYRPVGLQPFPRSLQYLDYEYVWNWLWYGRTEPPAELLPVPQAAAVYGIGKEAPREILDLLGPSEEPVFAGGLPMSGPAAILNSRW